MVKATLIALLLALLASSAEAARMTVSLDKKRVNFGEPVQLRVNADTDLTALDLTPLKKDFEVFSSATSGATLNGKVQSVLDATLYPLRAGRLTVPALVLGQARASAVNLEVLPSQIILRAWVSPAAPMVREATTLHLEILDEGDLTWTAPTQLVAPNIYLGPLSETARDVQVAGVTRRLREYRWPLLALKSEGQIVTFPMLDTYKFGQRWRFPVTPVTFRALPAPTYLPLYLPIGKPTVRAEPMPTEIFRDRPVSRVIDIDAPGLSAQGALQSLQFDPPRGMRMYAPSAAPINLDGHAIVRVTFNFVADTTNVSAFPEIQLPYFDPKTQRIEALTIPAAHLSVRDPLREKIYAGGLILFIVLCLLGAGIKTWPWWQRLRAKRAWLTRLNAASDVATLYRVLTRDAPWQANTLRKSADTLGADAQLTQSLAWLRFGATAPEISFAALKAAWGKAAALAPISAFE